MEQNYSTIKYKVLFLLCPIWIFSSANWFYNIPIKKYELIGYGEDSNKQIAIEQARNEIAKSISTSIKSNISIKKSFKNGEYDKDINQDISTSTNIKLQNTKIIKQEKIKNKWYIAVLYDNRNLIQKIQEKHKNFNLENIKDINLKRKHNNWYLDIKDDSFLIRNQDFKNIFSNIQNKNISCKTNKNIFNSNDKMQFKISSKHKGFMSIMYSESSGKVGIILNNHKINKTLTYPQKQKYDLRAYNPNNKTIIELYICVFSKQKLDLREFEDISENALDESNYKVDKLFKMIKNKDFVSIKVKIRGE